MRKGNHIPKIVASELEREGPTKLVKGGAVDKLGCGSAMSCWVG